MADEPHESELNEPVKESASPPFIQLLRQAEGGAVNASDLQEARRAFVAGLDETRESLNRLVSALSPEAVARCATARTRAQKAFAALRATAGGASADAVTAALEVTNRALNLLHQRALVELGPTSLGGINLIARVLHEVANNKTPLISLDIAISDELANIRHALASNEEGPIAEALHGIRKALEPLVFRAPDLPVQRVLELREALLAAAAWLEQAATRGDKTRIEALLENLRAQGEAGPVADVVPLLQQDLAGIRASLAAASGQGGEEAEAMVGLLERCDGLLGELQSGADVAEALTAALEEVLATQQQLERRAEREGTTSCVRCGAANPPQRRNCESCGAILPVAVEETSGQRSFEAWDYGVDGDTSFKMTENVQRMLTAIDNYAQDPATAETLLSEVAWLEDLIHQAEATPLGPDDPAEAAQLYTTGIQEMAVGAAALRQALNDGSPSMLEHARQSIVGGGTSVQRAQELVEKLAQ